MKDRCEMINAKPGELYIAFKQKRKQDIFLITDVTATHIRGVRYNNYSKDIGLPAIQLVSCRHCLYSSMVTMGWKLI